MEQCGFALLFFFFSYETTEQKWNSVFLYHFSVFTIRNNGTKTKQCVFALLFRFFHMKQRNKNGPLVALLSSTKIFLKIVSEYDQEIPQSQTADNLLAPRGRAAQPSRDTRKKN